MGAENLQDNLSKSLDEIEATANAILSKSEDVEKVEDKKDDDTQENVEKSVKPDEVSDSDDDGNDDEDKEDEKEDKKEDDGEIEKSMCKDCDGKGCEKCNGATKKSLREAISENEEIVKGIDASEFLSEFSRVHARVVDDLRFDVNKSLETSTRVSEVLSKSFAAIMKSQEGLVSLVKSQAVKLEESNSIIKSLQERLDVVEKQPVGRKAVVDVVEKSFNASTGIEEKKAGLSKGEVLAKMSNMIIKGVPGITPLDLTKFESTGQMTAQIKDLIENN